MAVFPTDFYSTLVAAGTIATESLKLPNNMIDSCYLDYDSNLAQFGQTVNIVIPTVDETNATDIANGGITGTTPADSIVPVTLDKKYSANRKIPDFDQIKSDPVRLADLYLGPVIEEVLRKLNRGLAGLVTAGNFNVNTPVTGVTADTFIRADISKAWAALRTQGVPIGDPNDLTMLVSSLVYGNMMAHSDFANWTVQGGAENDSVNRRAILLNQYNAMIKDDPMLPVTSGVYTGILMHKFAIALRTGMASAPSGGSVSQTVVYPKDRLPVHIQHWYEGKDQANYLHAFIPCGFAVARPSHGCILLTA